MSSSKGKRKRLSEASPLQGDTDGEKEQLMKRAMSSLRIQIVPGLWRRIVRRRRSKNDAKPWTCTCGYVNKPTQHLFFDLPRFKCGSKGCKEIIPDDYEFEFSLADIEANGICPLGNVKDQGSPHCMLYASSMNAESTSRITRILLGEDVKEAEPMIHIEDFLEKLKLKKHLPKSQDMNKYDDLEIKDFWKIVEILEKDGVETVGVPLKRQKLCKISGITHVPLDFAIICKEIADGSPLLTTIRTGKGFDDLKHNEIYKPPRASRIVEGKSEGIHMITLFGGGMRKGRKKHYKFVNTHGDIFCLLTNLKRKDGIKGGFGNVVAEGILRRPVKFLRSGQGILEDSSLNDPLKPARHTNAESESSGGRIQRSAAKSRQQYVLSDQGTKAGRMASIGDISYPVQANQDCLSLRYKNLQGQTRGPFAGLSIGDWLHAGCFGIDLLVQVTSGAPDAPFSLLGDVTSHLPAKIRYHTGFVVIKLWSIESSYLGSAFLEISDYGSINRSGAVTEDGNHFLESRMSTNTQNSRAEISTAGMDERTSSTSQPIGIDAQQHYSLTRNQGTLSFFSEALHYLLLSNADLHYLIKYNRGIGGRLFPISSPTAEIALRGAAMSASHPVSVVFAARSLSLALHLDQPLQILTIGRHLSLGALMWLHILVQEPLKEAPNSPKPIRKVVLRLNHYIKGTNSLNKFPLEFTETLRTLLLEKIDVLYLKAIAQLPLDDLCGRYHHDLLKAGHCFGPANDPVSNIILNTIWYDTAFPPHEEFKVDMICTNSLVRIECRSLDGLLAFLHDLFPTLSEHDALMYLLHSNASLEEVTFRGNGIRARSTCGKVKAALKRYAKEKGTEYELHVICGINFNVPENGRHGYFLNRKGLPYTHVNFLARPKGPQPDNTAPNLFFLECCSGEEDLDTLFSCCTELESPSYFGRCFHCEYKGTKIVHPPVGTYRWCEAYFEELSCGKQKALQSLGDFVLWNGDHENALPGLSWSTESTKQCCHGNDSSCQGSGWSPSSVSVGHVLVTLHFITSSEANPYWGLCEQAKLDKRLKFQSPSSQGRAYVVHAALNNIGKQKAKVAYEGEGTAHALKECERSHGSGMEVMADGRTRRMSSGVRCSSNHGRNPTYRLDDTQEKV